MTEITFYPYTDLDTDLLAESLHDMVSQPVLQFDLHIRHLWGVISRYGGSADTAKRAVERAQSAQQAGALGAFAIENGLGELIGSASIIPDLELYRQPFGIPPALSKKMSLSRIVKEAEGRANIAAWTDNSAMKSADLESAYHKLVELEPRSWTIEPFRSPISIVDAINKSMIATHSGYFDDLESNKHFVPRSNFFVPRRLT